MCCKRKTKSGAANQKHANDGAGGYGSSAANPLIEPLDSHMQVCVLCGGAAPLPVTGCQ